MSEIDFGHTVSSKEAMLSSNPFEVDSSTASVISDVGNELWAYHNQGTIHGIPVAEDSQNLPIDRDAMLDVAFKLRRTPGFKLIWMSPDDEESMKVYNDLLAEQAAGRIQILEEAKQYDMSKSKFMVWIRYDEVLFELNPRFAYLREEE